MLVKLALELIFQKGGNWTIMSKQQIEWCVSELIHLKRFCNNISITKDVITLFLDMLISNAKSRTGISAIAIKEYMKLQMQHTFNQLATYKKIKPLTKI